MTVNENDFFVCEDFQTTNNDKQVSKRKMAKLFRFCFFFLDFRKPKKERNIKKENHSKNG